MIKKSFILVLLIISTVSCEDKRELIEITDDCKFYNNILTSCFYGSIGSEYDENVFRDNESFQEYGDLVRIDNLNDQCDTAQLPSIDFENYSLLSKKTSGGGCDATYSRNIFKDTKNKKIIYEIDAEYEGNCKVQFISGNWAITPKIPDDYIIEFRLK